MRRPADEVLSSETTNDDPVTVRSTVRLVLESVEGVVVTAGILLSWPASKRWFRNWGARTDEQGRDWPGDALVPKDHSTYTRAIAIDAPPERVWPWLVQFGLGRAGFYSYELLERFWGIPVRNVESIVPRFQGLSVGDEVRLHPKAPGIPVALLEEERHRSEACHLLTGSPVENVSSRIPARPNPAVAGR